MKKEFVAPECELILLAAQDIVTASFNLDAPEVGGPDRNDDIELPEI